MIRRVIDIDNYWKVIVYYDIDYNLFDYIVRDISTTASLPVEEINNLFTNLITHKVKAFTYSSIKDKLSIVGFNKHKDYYDYINSIVHEAEHIKQDMLKVYKVKDSGEPPAYTIGFLVMKMIEIFDLL